MKWPALTVASSDGATYQSETDSILARTKALSVEIQKQEPEVVAAFAGQRPSREGGARIEKEEIDLGGEKMVIVHNYGAGGTGFQAGFGMALESVGLVGEELRSIRDSMSRARL